MICHLTHTNSSTCGHPYFITNDLWSNMWTSFSAWVCLGFINSTNWFVIKYVPTLMPAFIKISLTQTRVHLNFISKNKWFVIKHVYAVIQKVRTVIFRNFRPPFPHVGAHTLLSYKPSPLVQAHGFLFFKEDANKIYFIYTIKESHTSQNKEITVQNHQKISNQNTKKNPGIESALFNCTREIGIVYFGYLNRLPYFSSIL